MAFPHIEHGDPWKVTDKEIRHLCSYITDDGAIAGYLAIDRARVVKVRAATKTKGNREFRKTRHCGDQRRAGDEPAGTTVHQDRAEIEARSRKFLHALQGCLLNESLRLGMDYDDTLVLLVHGNDPKKIRAAWEARNG
jgi:hypothetical protein